MEGWFRNGKWSAVWHANVWFTASKRSNSLPDMKPTAKSCSRVRLASTTLWHCAKDFKFTVIFVTVRFITIRWSCRPMRSLSCTYTLLLCIACSPTYTLRKLPKKFRVAKSSRCRLSAP